MFFPFLPRTKKNEKKKQRTKRTVQHLWPGTIQPPPYPSTALTSCVFASCFVGCSPTKTRNSWVRQPSCHKWPWLVVLRWWRGSTYRSTYPVVVSFPGHHRNTYTKRGERYREVFGWAGWLFLKGKLEWEKSALPFWLEFFGGHYKYKSQIRPSAFQEWLCSVTCNRDIWIWMVIAKRAMIFTTLWFGGFWSSLAPHLVGKYIIHGSLAPPILQDSLEKLLWKLRIW